MAKHLMLVLMGVTILSSCSGLKRFEKSGGMVITPSPLTLQEQGGEVDVNYNLTTPKKFVKKGSQVIFTPQFMNGDNNLALTNVIINGKKFEKKEQRAIKKGKFIPNVTDVVRVVATKQPMDINVDDEATFQPWMQNSQLVGFTAYSNGRNKQAILQQLMADGVAYTAPVVVEVPVEVIEKVIEMKDEGEAIIHFKIDSYKIDSALNQNGAHLNKLYDIISKIKSTQNCVINSVVITGVASPDGPLKYNTTLSENRADVAKKFIIDKCGIPASAITVKYIAEDWLGLQKLLEASKLSDKSELIKSFSSNISDVKKNEILYKSPNFKVIAKDMLPKLRKVVYEIYFTKVVVETMVVSPM